MGSRVVAAPCLSVVSSAGWVPGPTTWLGVESAGVEAVALFLGVFGATALLFRRLIRGPPILEAVGGRVRRSRSEPGRESRPAPRLDDPELTDAERVRALLRRNGGRLRQGEIGAEFDWSKAKVSRLLSRMERRGEVAKIAIGRENLIALPGAEPDGVRSSDE